MPTLAEFLTARLNEREAAAREAAEATAPQWQVADHHGTLRIETVDTFVHLGYEHHIEITHDYEGLSDSVNAATTAHIVGNDPARVLREIAAARRLLNAVRAGFPDESRYAMGWHDLRVYALSHLAAVDADHPDFNPGWTSYQ